MGLSLYKGFSPKFLFGEDLSKFFGGKNFGPEFKRGLMAIRGAYF